MKRAKGVDAVSAVSAHLIGAGFATESAMEGVQASVIMGQAEQKSLEMVFKDILPMQKRQIQSLL